jgi:hypothetical protein
MTIFAVDVVRMTLVNYAYSDPALTVYVGGADSHLPVHRSIFALDVEQSTDGILVLVRPVDEVPKPLLLSRLVPALAGLVCQHNGGIPATHLLAVIYHGYEGLDGKEFLPLASVTVGRRRRKGWVYAPATAA